jgi:hypothetical protein
MTAHQVCFNPLETGLHSECGSLIKSSGSSRNIRCQLAGFCTTKYETIARLVLRFGFPGKKDLVE